MDSPREDLTTPPRSIDAAEPPPAPDIPRRTRLTRRQLIGLPVLFSIPLLALVGIFGESDARTTVTAQGIELNVVYPSRLRYRQERTLTVQLRNVGSHTLDSVSVAIDTAYLASFADLRVMPAPTVDFIVPVGSVPAGESRLVLVGLAADRVGRHRGRVAALVRQDTAAVVAVHSFVFP